MKENDTHLLSKFQEIEHVGGTLQFTRDEVDDIVKILKTYYGDGEVLPMEFKEIKECNKYFYLKDGELHLLGTMFRFGEESVEQISLPLSAKELSQLLVELVNLQQTSILKLVEFDNYMSLKNKIHELRKYRYHQLLKTRDYEIHAGRFVDDSTSEPTVEIYTFLSSNEYMYQCLPKYSEMEQYMSLNGYIQKIIDDIQIYRN